MESTNPYARLGLEDYAAFAPPGERTAFTRRTFVAFAVAVLCQIALLCVFFWLVPMDDVLSFISRGGRTGWLLSLAAYMGFVFGSSRTLHVKPHGTIEISAYVLHVVLTALVMIPLIALSSAIDESIPATAAVMALVVFGGLTAYAQFGTLESLKHRGIVFLAILSITTAFIISFLNGRGLSVGDWLFFFAILLAAIMMVLDIGNMMCRYRTDEWMRSSMALFSNSALLLCAIMTLAILIL